MSSTAAFYLLSTLGGYLVTSFLLLKYPTLLHPRKKQRFLSKHISHRGGERGSPDRWRRRGRLFPPLELRVLQSSAKGWRVEMRESLRKNGCAKEDSLEVKAM